MHDCWIAGWGDVDVNISAEFFMVGYQPGTRATEQVMIAGLNGGPTQYVHLREARGQAYISGLGRYCVVISYRHSKRRTYYELGPNRIVRFCRWKSRLTPRTGRAAESGLTTRAGRWRGATQSVRVMKVLNGSST
jgi:hypothetical protein